MSSGSILAASKTVATHLAEEGLVLAALVMPEPIPLSFYSGGALSLVALILLLWEHGYTERPPVIAGPYRFVRNPHGLAYWLLGLGAAIAARSFPAIVLVIVLLPWLFFLEQEGERATPDTRLLRYRFHVPTMIPTLIPFEYSPNQGFSWRRTLHIERWPHRHRLFSIFAIWAYLMISFNLKMPWWAGLIAAAAYIVIKLFLSHQKFRQFSFRKKAGISSKPT